MVPDRLLDILLFARLISASAGIATVIVVYVVGRRAYSTSAGLLAAAFVAVTPMSVVQPHYASVDVLLELMTALSLLAACWFAAAPSVARVFAGGFAAGLAFSTKYTGLQTLLPLGATTILIAWRDRSLGRWLVWLGCIVVGFLAAVAVACPPCLLDWPLMLERMGEHRLLVYGRREVPVFRLNEIVESLGWYGRPYLYQLVALLPFSLGWPLYLGALGGVGLAVVRRSLVDTILLVHVVTYFLLVAGSRVSFPRYMIPILPACCLLAGRLLVSLPARHARTVSAVVLLYTLALSASQVDRFSYTQQRAVADWIVDQAGKDQERSGPPTVGVATGYRKVHSDRVLRFYYGLRKPLEERGLKVRYVPAESWGSSQFDFLIFPDWLTISARRDEPHGEIARLLDQFEAADSRYSAGPVWRSSFLTSGLYTNLDPAFHVAMGEIGFQVFVKTP